MTSALHHFRRLLLIGSVLLLPALTASAQQTVGIGTATPHSSAALDISAPDKGLLIPRLTQAQRTAMTNVADGLLVFQTNNGGGFWYYYGGQWNAIPNATTSGDNLGNNTATGPLKYNFNDGDKIQFVQVAGTDGSKLTHTSNWALGYYAGPANGPFTNEGQHRFFTGGTSWRERMRITPSGTVGIGTINPLSTLDVNGEITSNGLRFSTNDADKILFSQALGANGPKLAQSTGWNLDYYAGPSNANNGTHRFFTGTATGWVERLCITPQGRVGIGLATPAATLDVNGDVRATVVNTATVTTPATGSHNMLAAAYGTVGGSGTVFGSSDNWTVVRTAAGTYRITFTGADLSAAALGSAVVQVSAYGPAAGFVSWDGGTGFLTVYLRNAAGGLADRSFSFVVFLP